MQKRVFLQGLGAMTLLGSALVARAQSAAPAKIAVVYFSKTGHTESVAKAVAHFTGADIFAVHTVEPYPEEYRATTEIVKKELDENVHRAIQPVAIDLARYETIVLGTPTWWHHVAMPLQTWIGSVDLKAKFIVTFNTHGGGGIMQTRVDFEKLLPNHRLGTHFTVFGGVEEDSTQVRQWLSENKLLA